MARKIEGGVRCRFPSKRKVLGEKEEKRFQPGKEIAEFEQHTLVELSFKLEIVLSWQLRA